MSTICPRCETPDARLMHEAQESGRRLWSVLHCAHCAFTWRDSEPATTIDPLKRPKWAQLKGVDLVGLRRLF